MEIEVWFKSKNEKFIALKGRQPDLKMFKRSPSSRPKLVITPYFKLKAWGSPEIADITRINGIHVSFLWDTKNNYWFCQLDEDKVEDITELSSGKKFKHLLMGTPKPKMMRGISGIADDGYIGLGEGGHAYHGDKIYYPETNQDVIDQTRRDIDEIMLGVKSDKIPINPSDRSDQPVAPQPDVVYEGVTDAQGNTDEILPKISTAEEPIAMTELLPLDVQEVQVMPQPEAPVAGTANKVMLKWGFRGRDIYMAVFQGQKIWFNRKTRVLYAKSAIFKSLIMINEVPVVFTAIDPNEPISVSNNVEAKLVTREAEFKLLGEIFLTADAEARILAEARKRARADAVQRYKSSVNDDEEARIVALEEAPRHPELPIKWTDIINTWPWGILQLDEDTEAEIELAPKQSGVRQTKWHQLTIITRLHKSPEIPEGGKVRMHPDLIPLKGCKMMVEGIWCGPFTTYDHLQNVGDDEQYYVPCLQCRVETGESLKIVEAVKIKLASNAD